MKIFKFKKFPKSVVYNNEEYTFQVGGKKCIEVHIEVKGEAPDAYIFYNVVKSTSRRIFQPEPHL